MILKIERYVDQDWWILDDIKKISKAQFNQHPDKDFSLEEADIFLLDYINHLKAINANNYIDDIADGKMEREVIKLICRLSDGSEFCVIFDTVGYLLNDSGKTIEKLVANYR